VGSEHVKSSITIDYDQTSGDSTEDTYDPTNPVVVSSQSSQETVADLEPSGVPGTPSNVPNSQSKTTATTQAKANTTTQGIRTESKTFAVSHTTRHVLEPAGRIKKVAAAILVDDVAETKTEGGKTQEVRRKRTAEELKQIEELAKAAIGFDAKRGDLFSLQNIAFVQAPVEVATPVGKIQKVMLFAERWTGVLRYVAVAMLFLVVYLLVLRPVQKQVMGILKTSSPRLEEGRAALVGEGGTNIPGIETRAGELSESASGEVAHTMALKKELVAKVKADPEAASRLVQNWMRKPEARQ